MDDYESLSHTKWDCKYYVVSIPKFRRKALYVELRRHLGEVFRKLAQQKESRIEEGHLMPDHIHMMISPFHQSIGFDSWYCEQSNLLSCARPRQLSAITEKNDHDTSSSRPSSNYIDLRYVLCASLGDRRRDCRFLQRKDRQTRARLTSTSTPLPAACRQPSSRIQ
jgi:hypothetical protein